MNLSYDKLLLNLILEYNNTLLYHPNRVSKYYNKYGSDFIHRKKRKNERKKKEDELQKIENEIIMLMLLQKRKRANDEHQLRPKKKAKYIKKVLYFTDPSTGQRSIMTYKHSQWWQNYIVNAQPEKIWWRKWFAKRFRIPYYNYLELVQMCTDSPLLSQWSPLQYARRNNKKQGVPMDLLVLCALRYLGRGWLLDDLSETVVVSIETIRKFIKKFIEFGSTSLYQKYVIEPTTKSDLEDCNNEFKMAGLPGCIGSTDATHIVVEKCIYILRQLHLGYKANHTARTYNLTCNHRRRILSTTSGHPARFNDKTLIMFDRFVNKIKKGKFDSEFTFELYDFDTNGNHIKVKYKGCYLIVDNGYHPWSITVPPIKSTLYRSEIRFSEWLESLRKDVECTFGILKGRWRILKYGIRLWGMKNCDQVWLTCCALHNWLLEIDGLSDGWENGVKSHWETEEDNEIPFALRRLHNPSKSRKYDISGMGKGNDMDWDSYNPNIEDIDVDENNSVSSEKDSDGNIVVRKMPLQQFRSKLIRHFNIAFHKHELVWPKRIKKNKTI